VSEAWRGFCHHGTNFVAYTSVEPKALTEAESADRPEGASVRSKRQGYRDFNCVQMRALLNVAQRSWVSGCRYHYKSVTGAGAKVEERSDEIPPWRGKNHDSLPRNAGSLLIIPSVLALVYIIFLSL